MIACKREAPQNKGDTSGVSTKCTLMLKSVSGTDEQAEKQSFDKKNSMPDRLQKRSISEFECSDDPDGLYSKWSQLVDMLRYVSIGADGKYYVSLVKRWRLSVRDGVGEATRADHLEGGSFMVGEVLFELVSWVMMAVCSRSPEES
ncbi:hypothetical protein TIFTF001_012114 [Ficus carica]|uniref:Uncharacterized protein n=1 Tax=Ficus carica TaxID=3494 RepID=A0AA88D3F4_FICCA|nr:hypothetical protein TIFTF001_012114 [Ficus carica]